MSRSVRLAARLSPLVLVAAMLVALPAGAQRCDTPAPPPPPTESSTPSS